MRFRHCIFRSADIRERIEGEFSAFRGVRGVGKAEIGENHFEGLAEEQVLGFYIKVSNFLLVQMFKAIKYLNKNVSSHRFGEPRG